MIKKNSTAHFKNQGGPALAQEKVSVVVISGDNGCLAGAFSEIKDSIVSSESEIMSWSEDDFLRSKNGGGEKKFNLVIIAGIALGQLSATDIAGRFPEETYIVLYDNDSRASVDRARKHFRDNTTIVDVSQGFEEMRRVITEAL